MSGKYTGAPGDDFHIRKDHLDMESNPLTMLAPCVANADCKNTPGSYECKCKDGYHGDDYSWCAMSRCPPGNHKYISLSCTKCYFSGMFGGGEWCTPIPEHGRCITDKCIDFDCTLGFIKRRELTNGDWFTVDKGITTGLKVYCEGFGSLP